ncbi:MAG: hypothetical protein COV29_03255 [Candidatus Yanofskybacteria bacterium CG10_big_fil_rev_8_21_14_0_10_36_16]|uniref:Cytochrome c domain-containing protein n=1 Tax=Candidatus Yanofskybacteria bacterium CG10_big_fil_rev_8_21_14_0_10_36_16 TaxID=1975096 RepID=A0A2J0Q6Z5_9BACT|nr:MAG: hypothetical protein COV29_03255 [Candidatus Yanofskybacteria bacterium CG10_big_fil_rev_8_21_14_0_10_36_16]
MNKIITALVLFFAVSMIAPNAQAVPQWANRYGMNCNHCHISNAWPRLNRMGYEFKLRGYRFDFEKKEISNPLDVVSLVYKFTNTQTKSAGKDWQGKTAYEEYDMFATVNFGDKSQWAAFSEIRPNEAFRSAFGLQRHARWFKAGNLTYTGGNEKSTYQIRTGRLPQVRGSMFMGNDRYPTPRNFIQNESVQGHKFGQNYGLGFEAVNTWNMRDTVRFFAMRVDEVEPFNDAQTYGGAYQHLFGGGNTSFGATYIHSDQPHRASGLEAKVDRAYVTASLDVNPKLLVLGGVAGGSSRDIVGVRRTDLGCFAEANYFPVSSLTLALRYDEIDKDWNSLMPKRGVQADVFYSLFSNGAFDFRAFAGFGHVFNAGNQNKKVVKTGVTATF